MSERLVRTICQTHDALLWDDDAKPCETFIANHYGAMKPDEQTLHQRIRNQTDTIKKLNRQALDCIEASKNFQRDIPLPPKLQEHLEAWLAKYDKTSCRIQPSASSMWMCANGQPFPTGIEAQVRHDIHNTPHQPGAATPPTPSTEGQRRRGSPSGILRKTA